MMHYQRLRKIGSFDLRINYHSGRYVDDRGYVMIHVGNNVYRGEHILFAEKALGKPLPEGAVVHHMNRDQGDNKTPASRI